MDDLNRMSAVRATTRLAGFISLAGIVAVNGMGVVDHDTESGMGCGAQWPLCHGTLVPAFSNEAVIIEYVHRLLTMGFTIALVIFLAGILRGNHAGRAWKYMSWSLTGLLGIEAAICTAGVLMPMPNALMSWLMPVGLSAQALLWIMTRRMRVRQPGTQRVTFPALAVVVPALVGYLYLGAWVSYTAAGMVVRDLMLMCGTVLAVMGLIWLAQEWRARTAVLNRAWPLLVAPFIVHFSRTTVGADLVIYLWLSWLTGVVAWRVAAAALGLDALPAIRQTRKATTSWQQDDSASSPRLPRRPSRTFPP